MVEPSSARAQFIGYSTPQTVTQTLFNNATCTGSAQTATVNNVGQTDHSLILPTITSGAQGKLFIEASQDGVTFTRVSDEMDSVGPGALHAFGYYPIVRASITCLPITATFSIFYSGTSVSPGFLFGDFLRTTTEKVLLNGAANSAGSNVSFTVRTPYANLSGVFLVAYSGAAGPANSTIQVAANYQIGQPAATLFNLATTSGLIQTFTVPPTIAPTAVITYTAGGASTANLLIEYLFYAPGVSGLSSTTPLQGAQLFNSITTSAANTAIAKTITANHAQRARVWRLDAFCSAGTTTLNVQDGSTTIWQTNGSEVTTTRFVVSWNVALSASTGNTLTVNLGACGAANTGTLIVQADQQ